MIRVLVLDPGERVGWATAVVRDGVRLVTDLREVGDLRPDAPVETKSVKLLEVEAHGISFLKDMALAVHKAVVLEQRYDVVVCESWQLSATHARKMVGDHMLSSQFIGMVRLCCWLSGTKLVMQRPAAMSTARRALNCGHPSADDIVARLDKLPKSHDDSHDGSALLHLWAWFFERYV